MSYTNYKNFIKNTEKFTTTTTTKQPSFFCFDIINNEEISHFKENLLNSLIPYYQENKVWEMGYLPGSDYPRINAVTLHKWDDNFQNDENIEFVAKIFYNSAGTNVVQSTFIDQVETKLGDSYLKIEYCDSKQNICNSGKPTLWSYNMVWNPYAPPMYWDVQRGARGESFKIDTSLESTTTTSINYFEIGFKTDVRSNRIICPTITAGQPTTTTTKQPTGNIHIGDVNITSNDIYYWPNLNRIEGNLIIEGVNDEFTNIFPNLIEITGNIEISYNTLTSISGFSRLQTINGNLKFNSNLSLTSIPSFDELTSIGGDLEFRGNIKLTSIPSFDKLTSIGGYLKFTANALTSISGFNALQTIGHLSGGPGSDPAYVDISYNNDLRSISGFNALQNIKGYLNIIGNTDYLSGNVTRNLCNATNYYYNDEASDYCVQSPTTTAGQPTKQPTTTTTKQPTTTTTKQPTTILQDSGVEVVDSEGVWIISGSRQCPSGMTSSINQQWCENKFPEKTVNIIDNSDNPRGCIKDILSGNIYFNTNNGSDNTDFKVYCKWISQRETTTTAGQPTTTTAGQPIKSSFKFTINDLTYTKQIATQLKQDLVNSGIPEDKIKITKGSIVIEIIDITETLVDIQNKFNNIEIDGKDLGSYDVTSEIINQSPITRPYEIVGRSLTQYQDTDQAKEKSKKLSGGDIAGIVGL